MEITRKGSSRTAAAVDPLGFLAGLKHYALQHGYGRGWVAHSFRERFGSWPKGLDFVEALPPSPEVRAWIRSRQIAYAKRRGAA